MKAVWMVFLLFLVIACSPKEEFEAKTEALDQCLLLCQAYEGELSAGPCLSNQVIDDWVCDIAHSPRQAIDNLPENQCSAFRAGQAHHFVELDEECGLIKLY